MKVGQNYNDVQGQNQSQIQGKIISLQGQEDC